MSRFKITATLDLNPKATRADAFAVGSAGVYSVERKEICESCSSYGNLSSMALEFEISEADRSVEEKVCTHPNCGCWRGVRRKDPWLRLMKCPDNKW